MREISNTNCKKSFVFQILQQNTKDEVKQYFSIYNLKKSIFRKKMEDGKLNVNATFLRDFLISKNKLSIPSETILIETGHS